LRHRFANPITPSDLLEYLKLACRRFQNAPSPFWLERIRIASRLGEVAAQGLKAQSDFLRRVAHKAAV